MRIREIRIKEDKIEVYDKIIMIMNMKEEII